MSDWGWHDCTIGFNCPNCGAQLIADSQNEPEYCDCGLKYFLSVKLLTELPNSLKHPDQTSESVDSPLAVDSTAASTADGTVQ